MEIIRRARRKVTLGVCVAMAAIVAAATAGVATAGSGGKSNKNTSSATTTTTTPVVVGACGYELTQPFSAYGDTATYYLAPGGNAETGTSWKLSGSASVATGKGILGLGTRVFSLQAGGAVTSAPFCITADAPTMRLSVRDPGVDGAVLRAEVIWTSADGKVFTIPVARIRSDRAGVRLVDPIFLIANLVPLLTQTVTTKIVLRFTSESGSWQVDDVYIDPFKFN